MGIVEGNVRDRSRTTLGLVLACLASSFLFTGVTLVFTAGADAAMQVAKLQAAPQPGV